MKQPDYDSEKLRIEGNRYRNWKLDGRNRLCWRWLRLSRVSSHCMEGFMSASGGKGLTIASFASSRYFIIPAPKYWQILAPIAAASTFCEHHEHREEQRQGDGESEEAQQHRALKLRCSMVQNRDIKTNWLLSSCRCLASIICV